MFQQLSGSSGNVLGFKIGESMFIGLGENER